MLECCILGLCTHVAPAHMPAVCSPLKTMLIIATATQVSMASGLDWNSEEEGTAGADALKVEDLIELSEGNSGQSTQASPLTQNMSGGTHPAFAIRCKVHKLAVGCACEWPWSMQDNTSPHVLHGIFGLVLILIQGQSMRAEVYTILQDPFQPSPASDVLPPHTQTAAQMAVLHASGWQHTATQAHPTEGSQQAASSVAAAQPAIKSAVPYASPFANNEALTPGSGSKSPLSASGGSGAAGLAASSSAADTAQQQSAQQQAMPPVVDFGCVYGAIGNMLS